MLEISVDVGGTFTDVVVSDAEGRFVLGKALTTPDRAFSGLWQAIVAAGADMGVDAADVLRQASRLTYGTTRATNAIVTRKTARTALLITEGFPDVLMLREGGKADPHDYTIAYPTPYVPKALTFEIAGRVNAEGGVEQDLDEAQIASVIGRLKGLEVEAVGVCLFWSILNPAHEKAVASLLSRHLPGVPVTLSHEVLPIVREYRRALATVLDASLKPLMQRHLSDLESDLRQAGFRGDLLVSTTIGGSVEIAKMVERPVHMVKSGPAMAPVAAWDYASKETDKVDVVVCDTGGTTFDVGLIRSGSIVRSRETWIGPKYMGEILALSSVDIRSVGAGGGSIAWVDEGGLLRVGPDSAGSEPGPACYGRGGTHATVTDAALVVGYIDPDFFLGGRMPLDREAAEKAVGRIADKMSLSLPAAASAILTVANERMISAIQDITISEGIDPRDSALVAGGGAAGLNIVPIARELGCTTVCLPRTASALSACGMQFSDIIYEATASLYTHSDNFDFAGVERVKKNLLNEVEAFRGQLAVAAKSEHLIEFFVEARYRAQIWELETACSPVVSSSADVQLIVDNFHALHERTFAVRDSASAVEFLTWKARISIRIPRGRGEQLNASVAGAPLSPAKIGAAFFENIGLVETSYYLGADLRPGAVVPGPAIVVEPTTTIVIPPEASVRVSERSNYMIATGA